MWKMHFHADSGCRPAQIRLSFRVQKVRLFLRYWLPVLLWASVICSFSSDQHSQEHTSRFFEPLIHWLFPHLPQDQVEAIHHVFRKCGHLSEFAILALLCWRAVRQPDRSQPRPWVWAEAGLAVAVVFMVAASDELHQTFVPGRTGQVSDVLIDTTGGAIALLAVWLWGRKSRPRT